MKIKQKKEKKKEKKKTLKITSETMLTLLQSKAVRERCFKRTACKKKKTALAISRFFGL